ncbi:DUF2309 domain-containing protein [Bacillus changyiensis]|uniref:DUF2309 domain-containing protein n=1 Tax=Bacillus changyiensis TaxID=3004103 RepID=UPI0022E138E0|nr:putative inorganic carbon transporter subunit DabA [Bacillus changyiensis]MDA1477242.1 Na-translocating system protein MpsB [Bacillus changyiensis]
MKNLKIDQLVQAASRVIAPLWPISTFAARNPWMGLEGQSFEEVAHWLNNLRGVDILPNKAMLSTAKNKGEIDQTILEKKLLQWLHSQSIDIQWEIAEAFCRNALTLDDIPTQLLSSSKVKKFAKKLNNLKVYNQKPQPIQPLSQLLEQHSNEKTAHLLDHHFIKWCKLYLDETEATWRLPKREKGFYYAWRQLIQHDPALRHTERQLLKDWPKKADDALKKALIELRIPYSEIQNYLEAHFLSLPGWAGMMLWRSQQSLEEQSLLLEFLAVRLSMEWMFVKPHLPFPMPRADKSTQIVPLIAAWLYWGDLDVRTWSQLSIREQKARLTLAERFDDITRRKLWLEAWEQTHAAHLRELITKKSSHSTVEETMHAQFVFCIDVRSEPFRRELEKAGPFETYGMAGFFGLEIETSELGNEHSHCSLPVILKPKQKVKETAAKSEFKVYQQNRNTVYSLNSTFKKMKQNPLASLVLPEISGPWLGLQMIARSFAPCKAASIFGRLRKAWLRKPSVKLSLDFNHHSETDIPVGFTEKEKVNYVRQALKMMGITQFAPLIVICGHGSHNTNNPYASSLDCGACGGASSGFNAQVLAELCNLPNVRKALESEGIVIPEDTIFTAAEHITTLDQLNWLHVPELSNTAQQAFDHINSVLPNVSQAASKERLMKLPHLGFKDLQSEVRRFAEDWSEVRPEWGLARNASFIIGNRQLTKELNLEGRAFLHSYDWKQDQDGNVLGSIISGPGTVAQWINLQYYASTVAPHYYGSGNKATQTVTSGLGVMQGNASDLLAGLPWQSVMSSDQEMYHAPLRLLVIIQAPREHVERLLNQAPHFRQKVKNGWLHLALIDPQGRWEDWRLANRTNKVKMRCENQ